MPAIKQLIALYQKTSSNLRIENKKAKSKKGEKKYAKSAILGGGDIAFPMLFSAAIMEHMIMFKGIAKPTALAAGGLISVFAAIALLFLLIKAEDGKFYPAMPFLSAGCFAGYLVVYLLF